MYISVTHAMSVGGLILDARAVAEASQVTGNDVTTCTLTNLVVVAEVDVTGHLLRGTARGLCT